MRTPLYDPACGPMRVVGLMSGSGSNLRRLCEAAVAEGSAYRIVAIFSDTRESQAPAIGADFSIPVLIHDKRAYYRVRGKPLRDLAVRAAYDAETVAMLAPFAAVCAAYAGYMSIATTPLIRAFLGVNVHPADLAIRTADGRRRYVGDHAVRDALAAGETTLRSTTHLIEAEVDGGGLLMRSAVLPVEWPEGPTSDPEGLRRAEAHNQARLKERGDWQVFPRTLDAIARGRFTRDESGRLYFDDVPYPDGLAL